MLPPLVLQLHATIQDVREKMAKEAIRRAIVELPLPQSIKNRLAKLQDSEDLDLARKAFSILDEWACKHDSEEYWHVKLGELFPSILVA